MTTPARDELIALAQCMPIQRKANNGNDLWVFNDWTVERHWLHDTYTVTHTPIVYTHIKPLNHDWTHELTTGEFYTFRVYPLPTGGEWRVPVNDAAIEAYEAGKADDGLYAWEWMAQWIAEQEGGESKSEQARRLL